VSQIAQLSEAEIEERFHIVGPSAIAFTLAGLAREGDQFSVHFGDTLFLTTLLAANPESGTLIFDCSGAEALNRRLLMIGQCSFAGRPEGVHVQFSCTRVRETKFAGRPAFVADLPKYIVRLQRRESFRIETPRGRPLEFAGRLADGSLLQMPVHDISVDGIGLTATQLPDGLARGDRLHLCHFHLADEAHELSCSADVCHVTELTGRSGQRLWRIGLRFDDLPPAGQNYVQRYIIRVERERKGLI